MRSAAAITPRTRVLSICHHQTTTDGYIMPVKELVALGRSRGLITVVDGAQAIGMIEVDIRGHRLRLLRGLAPQVARVSLRHRAALRPRRDAGQSSGPASSRVMTAGTTRTSMASRPRPPRWISAALWPKALLKYSSNFHYFGPLFWTLPTAIPVPAESSDRRASRTGSASLGQFARAELVQDRETGSKS